MSLMAFVFACHHTWTYNKLIYKCWLYTFLCFGTARRTTLKLVTVFFFWVTGKADNILIKKKLQYCLVIA